MNKSNKSVIYPPSINKRRDLPHEHDQETKSRRAAVRKSTNGNGTWKPSFNQRLQESIRVLLSYIHISTRPAKLSTKMCDNYGHMIEGQSWIRGFIHCADCGKRVTDYKELRRAATDHSTN